MIDPPDLFNFAARYPNQPGHRKTATSKAAAESVKDRAPTLRDKVLDIIKLWDTLGGRTADECAGHLKESVLSIRPRLSELRRLGKIYDSGVTRPNESGVQASVWRAY